MPDISDTKFIGVCTIVVLFRGSDPDVFAFVLARDLFRFDVLAGGTVPVIFLVGTGLVLTVVALTGGTVPVIFLVGTDLVLLEVARVPDTFRVILTVLPGGRICK